MSLNIKKAIKERGYEVREIAQKMNITLQGYLNTLTEIRR
jgi:predicted transcriptional regulator